MKNFLSVFLISLLLPIFCFAQNEISKVIGDITSILRTIAVAAAVAVIVIGGFQWMISAGDPSKIGEAKDKIYSALFGLLIIVLAETIAHLLGGK
jgi:uncharacterized membrane protein